MSTTYRCSMRPRRLTPAAICRMMRDTMRDLLRPGVRIMLGPARCTCGACGQILTTDILEISGHVARTHGRQSFTLVEVTDDGSEPGDD